jgi:CheY-like chemotaxis protein
MDKRILIFEDDEDYIRMLGHVTEDLIEDEKIDLSISFESCPNYCTAKIRIAELVKSGNIDDYNLILIDLKLPFAADHPEEGMDNEFLGFDLAKLLRQNFADKIKYLPISSLVATVQSLDSTLHNFDRDDVTRTIDKTDMDNLASEIVKMLIRK